MQWLVTCIIQLLDDINRKKKMNNATHSEIKAYFITSLNKYNSVDTTALIAYFTKSRKQIPNSNCLESVAKEVAREIGISSFEYRNHAYRMPGSFAKAMDIMKKLGYTGYC